MVVVVALVSITVRWVFHGVGTRVHVHVHVYTKDGMMASIGMGPAHQSGDLLPCY